MDDNHIRSATIEIANGLIDVNLGGKVFKKRIALSGKGKSRSGRVIVAYLVNEKMFFMHGFLKNKTSNITEEEKRDLKDLGRLYLSLSDLDLDKAVRSNVLYEVRYEISKKI